MSEYWKSLPRKFCKQCQCWITDNKASVDFHERGKKHKENVERQLKEARKRSSKAVKDSDELQRALENIEKKARLAVEKESLEWVENKDFKTGKTYWYNKTTGQSSWVKPNFDLPPMQTPGDEETKKSKKSKKSVEEVNKDIYSIKKEEEKPKKLDVRTGLGMWQKIETSAEPVPESEDLPQAEDYTVKQNKFELKTMTSITSLDVETPSGSETGGTVFKKRRTKQLRKRTLDDD